jgi:hypothetical protein
MVRISSAGYPKLPNEGGPSEEDMGMSRLEGVAYLALKRCLKDHPEFDIDKYIRKHQDRKFYDSKDIEANYTHKVTRLKDR